MPWLGIAAVSAGAVAGSLLRWAAGIWLNARWAGFPLGTLFVNCVGGLLIGAVLFWLERSPNELLRLLARHRLARRLHDLLGVLGRVADHAAARPVAARARPHAGPRDRRAGLCGARLSRRPGHLVALNQGGRDAALKTRPGAQPLRDPEDIPTCDSDKLTTTFQEALADAQSLAVTRDNPYIEPAHVLAAMLAQADGPKALLARAGVNVARLQSGARGRDEAPAAGAGRRAGPAGPRPRRAAAGGREGSHQARRPVHRQRDVPARRRRREDVARRARSRSSAPTASRSKRRSTRCAAARRSTAPRPKASARR